MVGDAVGTGDGEELGFVERGEEEVAEEEGEVVLVGVDEEVGDEHEEEEDEDENHRTHV